MKACRKTSHDRASNRVIILTVSGGGYFPFTHHLGGDFDHGKIVKPVKPIRSAFVWLTHRNADFPAERCVPVSFLRTPPFPCSVDFAAPLLLGLQQGDLVALCRQAGGHVHPSRAAPYDRDVLLLRKTGTRKGLLISSRACMICKSPKLAIPQSEENYFASSNPHPPHSRAYDRYNKFLHTLETSTPNSHRPFWTLSKTRLASCSSGILAGSTDKCWTKDRDTRRDPLAGILGGIH